MRFIQLAEKVALTHPAYGLGGWLAVFLAVLGSALAWLCSQIVSAPLSTLQLWLLVSLFAGLSVVFLLAFARSRHFPGAAQVLVWGIASMGLLLAARMGVTLTGEMARDYWAEVAMRLIAFEPMVATSPQEARDMLRLVLVGACGIGLGLSYLVSRYLARSVRVNVTFHHRLPA